MAATIFSLPSEIVELTLVTAAAAHEPSVISTLASTCRRFRNLVYQAEDHHLWRQIFLAKFDDPRLNGALRLVYPDGGPPERSQDAAATDGPTPMANSNLPKLWNWGAQYRARIQAEKYLTRMVPPAATTEEENLYASTRSDAPPRQETDSALAVTLSALISTLLTSTPFVSWGVKYQSPSDSSDSSSPPDLAPLSYNKYPIFLPDLHALSQPPLMPAAPSSSNVPWLASILLDGRKGYPPALNAVLADADGARHKFDDAFHTSQAGRDFYRMVACTGFILPAHVRSVKKPDGSEDEESPRSLLEKRVRRRARIHVYNLRYLLRQRHWGPFLPVESPEEQAAAPASSASGPESAPSSSTTPPVSAEPGSSSSTTSTPAEGAAVPKNEADTDDDPDDADYLPPLADVSDSEGSGDDDDDGFIYNPLPSPPPSAGDAPAPDTLRVDWAYLAMARIVVEANLSEASTSGSTGPMRGLTQLEGVRARTAPSVGEDWAGVTGVWRRCVCWMDYRDLVLNNWLVQLHAGPTRFADSSLLEAVRIIPMTISVVGTGEAPAAWPDRPALHVRGSVAGMNSPRRMTGVVRMTADGEVRWSLVSTSENGQNEWVTEGVQVAGLGSAMGVIGLWTGASHERTDPLGPFWQWKVG